MFCGDIPTYGWVHGWVNGFVDGWSHVKSQKMKIYDVLRHPTYGLVYGSLGGWMG